MNKILFFKIIFLLTLTACSSTQKTQDLKHELVRGEEKFTYSDKNGDFIVRLSSGFNKKEKTFFSKRSLEVPTKEGHSVLEQSIVISDFGSLKKRKIILRPKMSQFNVWFDGKKYFSELKINPQKKSIDVKMISPEKQWNGIKQVKLPSTKALYCFFSQLVECIKTIGFMDLAIKKETGSMNFYVIWEGYPYLNETFTDFPSELISRAIFEYDGKTQEGEQRFNLKVAGQSIFYVVDKFEKMKKMFWVSQGISMMSSANKKSSDINSQDEMKEFGGSIE